MIISHKYKFIFIKTRKTAGSSIEFFLDKYLDKNDISTGSDIDGLSARNIDIDGHVGYRWICKNFPKEWKTYYKFAVDRNPWDKTVSQYHWYETVKPNKTSKGFDNFVLSKKFNSYVDWNKYGIQTSVVVDELVQYENLHHWFRRQPIMPYNDELLSVRLKSESRPYKHYRDYYSKNTKRKISEIYKPLIDYFDYKF